MTTEHKPTFRLGDHRSRFRKLWDKLPWSKYQRLVRQWKRAAGV